MFIWVTEKTKNGAFRKLVNTQYIIEIHPQREKEFCYISMKGHGSFVVETADELHNLIKEVSSCTR